MILLPLQMVGDMLACLQKNRGEKFPPNPKEFPTNSFISSLLCPLIGW